MTDITIVSLDEGYIKILANPSTLRELSDEFTFDVPNAKFSPAFKARKWDGKIRLLDQRSGKIYAGLSKKIHEFAKRKSYSIEDTTDLNDTTEFSLHEAAEFAKSLNLPYEVRDYQLRAFALSIRQRRLVLISPTASGKSLIAYLIASYYRSKNLRTLIVVPNLSLVLQLHTGLEVRMKLKNEREIRYDDESPKIL
ncbi:MAG: hypothetical protein EBU08_13345 [Micrococcales bacterium]|nr:hypothetical protein [Micrococcales bacterium]